MNDVASRPATMSLEGVESLIAFSYTVQAIIERAGAPENIRPAQMRLGAILRDRELSMTSLGNFLGLEKSSVTILVDRSEARGLVRRVPSPSDRRSTLVQLTDRGRRLDAKLRRAVTSSVAQLFETLSPSQVEHVTELFVRVAAINTPEESTWRA